MAIRTGNLKEMDDSVCDRVQPSPKSKTRFDFESKQTKFYAIVNGKFDKFKLWVSHERFKMARVVIGRSATIAVSNRKSNKSIMDGEEL